MTGGLGGQGNFTQRNRINGVSPQRSFLRNENAFSPHTEVCKKLLLGGWAGIERQDGSTALSGAMGSEQQAVFIQRVPGSGTRMKDKSLQKLQRPPAKRWLRPRPPCIHTAVITQLTWQSQQDSKTQGENGTGAGNPVRSF